MAARPPQPTPEEKPSRRPPWWLIGLIGLGVVVFGYQFFARDSGREQTPLSEVVSRVKAGDVERIEVSGGTLKVKLKDGSELRSSREPDASLTESLTNLGVTEDQLAALQLVNKPPSSFNLTSLLYLLLPLLLIGMLFFSLRRSMGGAADQVFGFARSRARRLTEDRPEIRFPDIAGADEAKAELTEIVDFLRDPARYAAIGAHIPKGVDRKSVV